MVDVNFNALFDVTRAVAARDGRAAVGSRGGHRVDHRAERVRRRNVLRRDESTPPTASAESLMLELRDFGVKVSVVNPGSVATSFSERDDASWMLAAERRRRGGRVDRRHAADVLVHRVEMRTLTVPKKQVTEQMYGIAPTTGPTRRTSSVASHP